jgi:hypothetical protein
MNTHVARRRGCLRRSLIMEMAQSGGVDIAIYLFYKLNSLFSCNVLSRTPRFIRLLAYGMLTEFIPTVPRLCLVTQVVRGAVSVPRITCLRSPSARARGSAFSSWSERQQHLDKTRRTHPSSKSRLPRHRQTNTPFTATASIDISPGASPNILFTRSHHPTRPSTNSDLHLFPATHFDSHLITLTHSPHLHLHHTQ